MTDGAAAPYRCRQPLVTIRRIGATERTTMRGRVGVLVAVLLVAAGCGKSSGKNSGAVKDTVTVAASLSLTGSLSREGTLTREGYDHCADVVNGKGGVPVGDRKV
jgi:branched-chain amino acid transport system substrate-binding protein